MSEMVERVARAMAADYNIRHDCQHDFDDVFFPETVRDEWRLTARAAMVAMREPTPGMERAAYDLGQQAPLGTVTYADLYRAMIDAALEE
jgi:hypothetical protein